MLSRATLTATTLVAMTLAHPAAAAPVRHASRDVVIRDLMEQVGALRQEVDALRAIVGAQAADRATPRKPDAPPPVASGDLSPSPTVAARLGGAQTVPSVSPPATLDHAQTGLTTTAQPAATVAGFVWKGVRISPGGFVELAGIYRDHFQGNDVASSLLVPFPSNGASHVHEARLSARQSRFSLLTQGQADATTQLAMFAELDFLGAAQTANSNQSNSYNPRLRHLYGTIDWDRGSYGLHLLAGQSWSLLTPNIRGIVARTEFVPPQIESQNIPGYYWARQPGVRFAADFLDHRLWFAASVENPQTTFAGAVPRGVIYNQAAGQGFDSANTLSINQVPDVVGKIAYDADIASHAVHLESFGLARTFTARLSGDNEDRTTFSLGGGMVAQLVPGHLDIEFTVMHGRGIGRYGSVGLPDVTFTDTGRIAPIPELMLLGGGTVHASHALDLYMLAGLERQTRTSSAIVDGVPYGVGNPLANTAGCELEGGTCAANTRQVRQLTVGLWDRFYQGSFGRAQFGVQYSLTQRKLFAGVGGAPEASNNMGFLSFRYYPF